MCKNTGGMLTSQSNITSLTCVRKPESGGSREEGLKTRKRPNAWWGLRYLTPGPNEAVLRHRLGMKRCMTLRRQIIYCFRGAHPGREDSEIIGILWKMGEGGKHPSTSMNECYGIRRFFRNIPSARNTGIWEQDKSRECQQGREWGETHHYETVGDTEEILLGQEADN